MRKHNNVLVKGYINRLPLNSTSHYYDISLRLNNTPIVIAEILYMLSDKHAFDACPQDEEADSFHKRILNGLLDTFSELAERHQLIQKTPEAKRNHDEREFLLIYNQVRLDLEHLIESELSYDKKYELAQEIQQDLMDMNLL
ncbi:MAG: hypothetical protein GY814_01995 [Gammaproteobacteria bacterium]|nr:hypothetical protein [Gammaproteobacteria bacterium]